MQTLNALKGPPFEYRLKDVGEPTRYLGAQIGRYSLEDSVTDTWFMSADAYLDKALPIIEERFGSLKSLFTKSCCDVPAPPDYHPELDQSPFLNDDDTKLYQSYIGIMLWAVEIGCIDLACTASTMAKFMAAPCEGHLMAVVRAFAYAKRYHTSKLVFDPIPRNWSSITRPTADWHEFYPDAFEPLPEHFPSPRGQPVQINMFCDAAHATDLITRRYTTWVGIFLNGAPIKWYSKRQNTIESSTFGSEFVALRIAAEMNDALRYKLRMFGIPIDGPSNTFSDNESVVINATRPESVLKKKHNYQKVRECVASESMRIKHERGIANLADVLTKWLPAFKHMSCCKCMMWP
jgi:hypothetical protein